VRPLRLSHGALILLAVGLLVGLLGLLVILRDALAPGMDERFRPIEPPMSTFVGAPASSQPRVVVRDVRFAGSLDWYHHLTFFGEITNVGTEPASRIEIEVALYQRDTTAVLARETAVWVAPILRPGQSSPFRGDFAWGIWGKPYESVDPDDLAGSSVEVRFAQYDPARDQPAFHPGARYALDLEASEIMVLDHRSFVGTITNYGRQAAGHVTVLLAGHDERDAIVWVALWDVDMAWRRNEHPQWREIVPGGSVRFWPATVALTMPLPDGERVSSVAWGVERVSNP
jgi:hypothetical protein